MKLQIEVTSSTATIKSGTSKTGKAYRFAEQTGMVTYPNGERRRSALLLDDNEPDLSPGLYEPTDSAVYPGDYGAICISMNAKNWQRVDPKSGAK